MDDLLRVMYLCCGILEIMVNYKKNKILTFYLTLDGPFKCTRIYSTQIYSK